MNKASATDILDFLFDIMAFFNYLIDVFRNFGNFLNRN